MSAHALSIALGTRTDLTWAQDVVTKHHYLHQPVDPRARPMLWDVPPRPAVFDGVHIAIGYPVIVSDCLIWLTSFTPTPNLYHLGSGEFGEWVIFAKCSPGYGSSLDGSVSVIVSQRSQPQMVGVDTRWRVALVADCHVVGYNSIVDSVTEAMDANVLSVLGEYAVALLVLAARPKPAFVVAAPVYALPELIQQIMLASIEATMTVNVLQWLTLYPPQRLPVAICNRRLLPAPAHAKPARVRVLDLQVLAFVVAWKETGGVPLAVSLGAVCAAPNRCSLTASALALPIGVTQAVLCYPRGVFVKVCREDRGRGMIAHVIRSFQRLTKPRAVSAAPWHFYWLLQEYFTTVLPLLQPFGMSLFHPMVTDAQGSPAASSSGKVGWCWPLPEPGWAWGELSDIKPRTLRMF